MNFGFALVYQRLSFFIDNATSAYQGLGARFVKGLTVAMEELDEVSEATLWCHIGLLFYYVDVGYDSDSIGPF